MDVSLASLGRSEKESSLSQKVLRLFRVLKEEKVCIPSDYECSVCWIVSFPFPNRLYEYSAPREPALIRSLSASERTVLL